MLKEKSLQQLIDELIIHFTELKVEKKDRKTNIKSNIEWKFQSTFILLEYKISKMDSAKMIHCIDIFSKLNLLIVSFRKKRNQLERVSPYLYEQCANRAIQYCNELKKIIN